MKQLLKYSNDRKKTAEKILKETGIVAVLKQFGKVMFVGSFANNTMIKPDIDIVIKAKNKPEMNKILLFLKKFISNNRKFFGEWTEDRKSLSGKSIHFFYRDELDWKFDVLLTTKTEKKSLKLQSQISRAVLNKKIRNDILTLKYYFYKRKLRLNGLSVHIYNAVIKEKIKDIKNFMKYLEVNGVRKGDFKK